MGRHEQEHGHHDTERHATEGHGTAETEWHDELEETTASAYERGTTEHTPGGPGPVPAREDRESYEHGSTEHTPGAPGAATVRDPEDEAKYEHGTTEHTPGAPGTSKRHD